MRVVTVRRLILNMRRRNRDPARTLLRGLVNLIIGLKLGAASLRHNLRNRRRQRRLAVVNMANRAYVHMRLGTIKLLLGHASPSSSSVCRTVLRGTVPDC
jgi:hypothetical protein